jgi:hypothetical protein
MSIPVKVEILAEQLRIERQINGFDMCEVKAENRTLLRQRILPLVMDAIDSLEIDPAAPQVALSRLQRIARLIAIAAPLVPLS